MEDNGNVVIFGFQKYQKKIKLKLSIIDYNYFAYYDTIPFGFNSNPLNLVDVLMQKFNEKKTEYYKIFGDQIRKIMLDYFNEKCFSFYFCIDVGVNKIKKFSVICDIVYENEDL